MKSEPDNEDLFLHYMTNCPSCNGPVTQTCTGIAQKTFECLKCRIEFKIEMEQVTVH